MSHPANFQCPLGTPGVCLRSPFLELMSYLPAAVSSQTRLFADDCILYRSIRHFSLTETLQNDLDKLAQWGMQFHPDRYSSMSVTRSKSPFKYNYFLKGHNIESVDTAKYRVAISSNMTWNTHK